ncbi:hypothetical protein A2U01_0011446, partial [Trifolium medium]|nr:hypothetical protein [Trifolium medium]
EMADDLDYLHEMAGRFPAVNDLGANVDTAADIEDALHQLTNHSDDQDDALHQLTNHSDDQGGVELSLDLEGRRKKRHECDADEGDPSSKKCKLGVSETPEVVNVQTGVTSPLPSSSAPLSVGHLLAHFSQLSVTHASCSGLSVDVRSQEFLRSFGWIASELSRSDALLASGPVSFEFVPLEARMKELEREVARLNNAAAAQSREREAENKALRKRDIKEYGQPSALHASLEQERSQLVALNDRLQKAVAIGIRAFALGFEEALKQVEANYPKVELDRSVFKPPNRSAAKTQPPVVGNAE